MVKNVRKIFYLLVVVAFAFCFLNACKDTSHEHTPCEKCGLCTATDCDGTAEDKCAGHKIEQEEPPVDTKVTLFFETYGGDAIEPVKVEPGTTVTLPTPVRAGYTFDYWYTTKDLDFNTDVRKTIVVNETMTIYAGWFAIDYNIEFVTNCSLKVLPLNAYTDEPIELPVLERANYEFLGWYDEEDRLYTRTTMEPRNITLTAKWGRLSIDITLDADGGTVNSEYQVQVASKEGKILLPVPEKKGYTFVGWYNNNELVTADTIFTKDATITAKYEATSNYKDTYKIVYETGEAILEGAISSYKAGQEVSLPTPKKSGYLFLGWYLNPEFEGVKVSKISVSDFGNKTVYAKWVAENAEYNINFVDHNGNIIETQKVKYGALAKSINYDGEAYIKYLWFDGNHVFDFNTPITKDITLTAKWEILANVLEDLVPNRVKDNIDLPAVINTSLGELRIYWGSSDANTIDVRGGVNPLREDTKVTLTATFSYQNQSYVHTADVVVEAVEFRDLSKTTPVFGYFSSNMGNYKGLEGIPAETIDVINYCFARITKNGTVSLGDLIKIDTVVEARKQGIRVMYSVGAYGTDESTGCHNISRAASTPEGRAKLIGSIIDSIKKYHLDGVDIDWEYPGHFPAPGISTAQDRANYMLFMRELRAALDELGEGYLLTAAVPGGNWATSNYDVAGLAEIMDYLHLMTYDLHNPSATSHHTPLYSAGYAAHGSVDSAVHNFVNAGFPKEKLVVGAAFYGRIWTLDGTETRIMGAGNLAPRNGDHVTYTSIKNDYLKRSTARSYWDEKACAPYIYDSATHEVISYDNPNSIKHKCRYVLDNEIGGLMFWDYGEDLTGSLINAIHQILKQPQE